VLVAVAAAGDALSCSLHFKNMATPRHTYFPAETPTDFVFPLSGTRMLHLTSDLDIFEDYFNVRRFAALNFMQFNVLRHNMKFIDELIGDAFDSNH
jgi:hypothetical protein